MFNVRQNPNVFGCDNYFYRFIRQNILDLVIRFGDSGEMSEVSEGQDTPNRPNSKTDRDAHSHSSTKRHRERALEELSEEDEYDSSDEKHNKKRKKAGYVQKYNRAWESETNFKDWVSLGNGGNSFFYCKVCNSDYTTAGGRSNLIKHSREAKHLTRLQTVADANLKWNIICCNT